MTERGSLKTDPVYQHELGTNAFPGVARELASQLSATWVIPDVRPVRPALILIGGFPGSGKTSITTELSSTIPVIPIFVDAIRHKLFKRFTLSEDFVATVYATRNLLLHEAMSHNRHVLLDENATPVRRRIGKMYAAEYDYDVVSVYLQTPKDVLMDRVDNRIRRRGLSRGRLEDLLASMERQPHVDTSDFDFIVDTTVVSARKISALVRDNIEALQVS